jgi:polysaccharide pyruvyl transferase WcaK-like protein
MKSVVFLNDTTTQMHHGCELVMKQIRQKLLERDIKISAYSKEGTDWQQDKAFMKAMRYCDAVVVNGEGTIHHNRPAGRLLLEVVDVADKLNKPCILINTTYQGNPAEFKSYLDKFKCIFVREGQSAEELQRLGVKSEVIPDVTLSYNYHPARKRTKIGVSDSAMTPVAKELYKLCTKYEGEFLPVIRSTKHDEQFRVIESLREMKFEVTKLFLKFSSTDDYLARRNLCLKKTINSYFNEIASCKVVVSGRFHVICFCILTETPFLAIDGNSHKIQSMLKDIGVSDSRLISVDEIDSIDLGRDYAFSKDELLAVRRFKQISRDKVDGMFDKIVAEIQ